MAGEIATRKLDQFFPLSDLETSDIYYDLNDLTVLGSRDDRR